MMTDSNNDSQKYSIPDQPARFAKAQKENNQRYLDITTVYDPSFLRGKRVAITGANRGLGLAIATECAQSGAELIAIVRSTSNELEALKPSQVIEGVDVTDDNMCDSLRGKVKGGPVDILINNSGYFMKEVEAIVSSCCCCYLE